MNTLHTTSLERNDIMELEAHLAKALRGLIPFASHSLYFPAPHTAPQEPEWISRERTLLLPLMWQGTFLGVFMARGVDRNSAKRMHASLANITNLCLEHLVRIKQSRTDEVTGLIRMNRLIMHMQQNVDLVLSRHTEEKGGHNVSSFTDYQTPLYKVCMGLVVIRCPALSKLAVEFGYMFAHKALCAWTTALKKDLPHEVLAARSGEDECTLLVPLATRTACIKLIEEIMSRVEAQPLVHEATKRTIRLYSVAGFALYPQDIEDRRLALPFSEQSYHLLHKARLAAELAYERSIYLRPTEQANMQSRYLAYGRVLTQGGIVRKILPHNTLMINLGHNVGVREGQRFGLLAFRNEQLERKGEIILKAVGQVESIAHIVHHTDPTWPIQEGDFLRITHEKTLPQLAQEHLTFENPHFLTHEDFTQKLPSEAENTAQFTLALVHLQPSYTEKTNNTSPTHHNQEQHIPAQDPPLQSLDCLAKHCLTHLQSAQESTIMPKLCGRYGETNLIFFHPTHNTEQLQKFYERITEDAKNANMTIAVGLASYPFLQSNKGDMINNCKKALDLALLLPAPQVGIMGSLALNISADKYYSNAQIFEAIEEYKLAILADATNAMAWNSLGVCFAALSRPNEARNHFKEAVKLWKKAPATEEHLNELASTLYNLGTICQILDEKRSAARYLRQCISTSPNHYFAHIRLGQLAENATRYNQARQYFLAAANLEDTHKERGGMARRHLARIALRQRKDAQARELLHEALVRNPQDASALHMLAEMYLQSGEDASMVEMLARKSLSLRPDNAASWRLLARALRALGKEHDALNAEDRAATL